jgi:dimethylhistidine N-methyltransferase
MRFQARRSTARFAAAADSDRLEVDPSPLEAFRDAVLHGLNAREKSIPSKYLYDEQGSRLFEEICRQAEYYPTRTELGLLAEHAEEIALLFGRGGTLIELGSGASDKVRILLDTASALDCYIPVDISHDHLQQAARTLAADYPALTVLPVTADYTRPFDLPAVDGPKSGFFPGSTIGNFLPGEAIAFLAGTAALLGPGSGLLIGVDLQKDLRILLPAYDDAAGVTRAFNLNLLTRINRELDADFEPDAFAHEARYDLQRARIEMHLKSLKAQTVRIGDHAFDFAAGETIHTENSHKYTVEGFHALAGEAGWLPHRTWIDAERRFSVHFLQAKPVDERMAQKS